MAANDIIVLNSILEQKKIETANSWPDDDFFELFTFEQRLKEYTPSDEQLQFGKIGGGDDGGIDGFFTFVNDELIEEEPDKDVFKKNSKIELFVIQSKRSSSFEEKAVDKFIATSQDIFDLQKDISEINKFYNAGLIEKISIFRKIYLKMSLHHPTLKITYVYATKGDKANINPKIHNKAKTLEKTICECFTGATTCVEFMGVRELLEASRQEKSYTLQLKFLENYISRDAYSYVVLSSITDYYDFVTDESRKLRKHIFEANVRDYQGNNVEVNKDIQKTLESDNKLDLDFWWLNNGVTILASKASIVGKTITLDDVEIVNGLQTTHTIFNYLKAKNVEKDERRSILIKIVVTTEPETRDSVIKATNFQTPIPVASLKATEDIQRDIESYFYNKDWFYDRRKNYYKNNGKPMDRIISIPYLAQAVMAIVLGKPDISRAQPSSIIKTEQNYKSIFKSSFKMDTYLFSAKTMKQVESFIRTTVSNQSKQKNGNQWFQTSSLRILSFHLAMLVIVKMLGKTDYKAIDVESLLQVDIKEEILNQTLSEIIELTNEYLKSKPSLSINTIAKQKDFVTYLRKNVKFSTNASC
ncbi:AIPR family protein [Argonema galeatum]|uniref:AIPR family protein n=1 Tax=Argonema galeatum TaxID=2942762 RepID=UPI002011B005|nr:AIPR family protein [Argonema galeatum]MCL1463584.1 AIPR family protein [Argonema galeatum A003/A1]